MADGGGDGPSPGTAPFVGGFATGLFRLAAGLAHSAAPGVRAKRERARRPRQSYS